MDWLGPRSKIVWRCSAEREEGRAGCFVQRTVVDFSNPKRGPGEPGPYKSEISKYAPPRKGRPLQ